MFKNSVYEIIEIVELEEWDFKDFIFYDDNNNVLFSSLAENKFIILNFWATWCMPCRDEIYKFVILQEEYKKDIIFCGIAFEKGDIKTKRKKLETFVKFNKLNYINFIMSDIIKNDISKLYGGIEFIPTTFFINKEKKIISIIDGVKSSLEELRTIINNIINY